MGSACAPRAASRRGGAAANVSGVRAADSRALVVTWLLLCCSRLLASIEALNRELQL